MKYLVNGKRTITTENWQERMGDISIEDYAKENGFEIVVDVESVLIILAIISLLSLSLNE